MKPFHQYKTGHGFGLFTPAVKSVELDHSTMSATGVFATTSLDRVGDVLDVSGIVTDNHKRNPITLWNHGQQLSLPIGICESPDKVYTVVIDPEAGEARCTTFFSQHLLEAEQIYNLIDEGVIRAMSIGYRPLKAKRMKGDPESIQRPGLFLESVDLLEASFVAIPANQDAIVPANLDAIQAALSRDKVCGKSLAPSIRRGLLPLISKSNQKVSVSLLTRKGGIPMNDEQKNVKADPADEVVTPVKDEMSDQAAELPVEEGQKDDIPQLPLGAEILTMVHHHLMDVMEYCNGEMPRLENERLSSFLSDLCDETFAKLAAIEEVYAAEYPDLEPLPASDDEGESDQVEAPTEAPTDAGEAKPVGDTEDQGGKSKSYSVGSKRFTKAQSTCVKEAAEALGEMSEAENLDKTQKVTLRYYSRELGQMVDEPMANTDAGDEELTPEQKRLVEAKIKRLELHIQHKKRLARQKALKR
jgi:HK97 family phage prohead protease